MSTPTSIPAFVATDVVGDGAGWRASLRAMASTVSVVLGPGTVRPDDVYEQIGEVFADAEKQCTRFDPTSDLMRANAAGDGWCQVGPYCYTALTEALRAHEVTSGMFDPRVLRTLDRLGYGRSIPFGDDAPHDATGEASVEWTGSSVEAARGRWQPEFDRARRAVRVGVDPIDLGGIGKGLAVRWAAERIDAESPSYLLDAGGDCYARGTSPDGAPWQIGVEDPRGGDRPRAVIAISDAACVTSSIRLRRWKVGGRDVHHLIDPRTGTPGGAGLLAVTVVGSDPAESEIWSKVFFLHGRAGIAAAVAAREDFGVLWVLDDGSLGMNDVMRALVIWQDES